MKRKSVKTESEGKALKVTLVKPGAYLSASYFYVSLGGLPMQVISADGQDVEPVQAKEILLGMAETYDVLFTVPEHKNFELRATAQDVTGYASAWIGMGPKVSAQEKEKPDLYAPMNHGWHAGHGGQMMMNHSGTRSSIDHSQMDHSKMAHSQPDAKNMDHGTMDHSMMDHESMDHSKMNHAMPSETASGPLVETLAVDDLKSKAVTTLPKGKKISDSR